MLLFNLRHYDTTKKPKQSGTSPWSAKSIWCYWSWNIGLDDGNVRRSSEINLRERSYPKKTTYQGPRTPSVVYVLRSQKRCCSDGNSWKQRKSINANSKVAHRKKTGCEIKQDSRLPRKVFQASNFADDDFQKEEAFPRQKVVAATNLPQTILRNNSDVCGKKNDLKS